MSRSRVRGAQARSTGYSSVRPRRRAGRFSCATVLRLRKVHRTDRCMCRVRDSLCRHVRRLRLWHLEGCAGGRLVLGLFFDIQSLPLATAGHGRKAGGSFHGHAERCRSSHARKLPRERDVERTRTRHETIGTRGESIRRWFPTFLARPLLWVADLLARARLRKEVVVLARHARECQ